MLIEESLKDVLEAHTKIVKENTDVHKLFIAALEKNNKKMMLICIITAALVLLVVFGFFLLLYLI